MLVHHYTADTHVYIASSEADESPLEPGVFLIPAYATEVEPPAILEGQQAVFDGEAWTLEGIPVPVNMNIVTAPTTLFGGPTLKEVFSGN